MSHACIARRCVRQSGEGSAFDVAFQIRRRCQIRRERVSGGARVGIASFIPAVMEPGGAMIWLEPDARFAGATLDGKRYCVLNSRSGVRYRTAAAAGKFP